MFSTRTQRDSTYLNGTQHISTGLNGTQLFGVSSEFMGTQRIFMVFLRISWGLNGSLRSSSEFIGVVTDLWGCLFWNPKNRPAALSAAQLSQQRGAPEGKAQDASSPQINPRDVIFTIVTAVLPPDG